MTKMIPTAEEYLRLPHKGLNVEPTILEGKILSEKMIEFAKIHVEACKEEIAKKATIKYKESTYGILDRKATISKNSILNAYPLTNIK